ncbi:Cna B-type domain-containing protein [Curtanaerobium respiraculi]|uniref:Cna B-type domain-containing protein n=1 Tax=Curtanaerobium respiraculi TaxID=2949669 RepID=UPI0024B386AC|nr:Cna B-type domain-containing protein [Curtanaerobium respiraculi]
MRDHLLRHIDRHDFPRLGRKIERDHNARTAPQVEVSKVWKGDAEGERPRSVTVQLLNGGTVIDSAILSTENGHPSVQIAASGQRAAR